jgi:hypothetical protein
MPFGHARRSFPGNSTADPIILSDVLVSILIPGTRRAILCLCSLALITLALLTCSLAQADTPASRSARESAAESSKPAAVQPNGSPAIVVGILGGWVHRDDQVHSTVQLAQDLRKDYPAQARVVTFENHRWDDAHKFILQLLDADHDGSLSPEEKSAARIILYGHSWGASAVVALARSLQADGIPVLLTIQVDSIAKKGQNDGLIPVNVEHAANFYQTQGFLHGRSKIQAADPARTQILGNFRVDYSANPISCPQYPWYDRIFMRTHIEIECDPTVWHRVEDLIRGELPSATAAETQAPAR